MTIHDLLRLVRTNALWIVGIVLLCVSVGLALAAVSPPQYQAQAQVFVSVRNSSNASVTDLSQGSNFTEQAVKSYAAVATTPIVLDKVRDELGLEVTSAALARQVVVQAPLDTVILEITTKAASPVGAAKLANSVARNLTEVVRDITSTGGSDSLAVQLSEIQSASPSQSPVSPRPLVNGVLGLVIGLVLAAAFVLLRVLLDVKIRTETQLKDLSRLPLLGAVGWDAASAQRPLVVHSDPTSTRAEAFRSLRSNLRFLLEGEGVRVLVMTSSVASEGKSTSCANLAIAMSKAGRSVLLVDADLRRPQLGEYFGLEGAVGLSDVLIGEASLATAVQRWGTLALDVLPAGALPPNPNELLQNRRMAALIEEVRSNYDFVLFDAPPVLPVSDAVVLTNQVDGAIVLCAANKTSRFQLQSTLSALEAAQAPVLGTIFNMVRKHNLTTFGYGYGYNEYRSDPTRRASAPRLAE